MNTADPVILTSLASKLRPLQPDHQYKFVQEINSIFNEIVQAMTNFDTYHGRPLLKAGEKKSPKFIILTAVKGHENGLFLLFS